MEDVMVFINNTKKSNMCKELKENLIKEYCKEKGYHIEYQEYIGYLTTIDLINYIADMCISDVDGTIINKVIVIGADELTRDYEKLFAINTTLKELEISIETIGNGVIGKDITFQLNVNKGEIE